jgi:hypothetical protein
VGDSLEEFLVSATNDAKLRQLMMSMSEAIRTIAFKVSRVPVKPTENGLQVLLDANQACTITALHTVRTPCHVPVGMPAPGQHDVRCRCGPTLFSPSPTG